MALKGISSGGRRCLTPNHPYIFVFIFYLASTHIFASSLFQHGIRAIFLWPSMFLTFLIVPLHPSAMLLQASPPVILHSLSIACAPTRNLSLCASTATAKHTHATTKSGHYTDLPPCHSTYPSPKMLDSPSMPSSKVTRTSMHHCKLLRLCLTHYCWISSTPPSATFRENHCWILNQKLSIY